MLHWKMQIIIIHATYIVHNFIKNVIETYTSYEMKEGNLNDTTELRHEKLPSEGGNATKDALFSKRKVQIFLN